MSVKREFLGEAPDKSAVYAYHIVGEGGLEVSVMNYGAVIRDIKVPTKDGRLVDVCLGFEKLEDYFGNAGSLGATVGPCANRTARGTYVIDGVIYHMPVNEGENNLHSDLEHGFYNRIWEVEEGEDFVKMSLDAPDGDIGFPGNRSVSVTFTVTKANELQLHYIGTSDSKTLLNLTNHAYFNLSGADSGSCLDEILQLNASNYTPVDAGSIPTGEIASVEGTPMDFRKPKTIGRDIDADFEQLHLVSGYDHNFCIDEADGTLREFATATSPATGITMHCFTDLPGFQFYSGNFLKAHPGKGGKDYTPRNGFCLETQFYPNAINTPEFPKPIFGPGQSLDSVTVYAFS